MKIVLFLLVISSLSFGRGSTRNVYIPVDSQAPNIQIENIKIFTLHKGLTTSKGWLTEVAKVTECVIKNEEFLKAVGKVSKFTFTDKTPMQVEQDIRTTKATAVLSTYYKKWTKVIAYRNVGSNIVYFNTRKNPTLMKYMVNTAVHEWLHVVGYNHRSASDWQSVPYQVGDIAEKFVEVCE